MSGPWSLARLLHTPMRFISSALGVTSEQTVRLSGGGRVAGSASVLHTARFHSGNVQIQGSMEDTVTKAGREVQIAEVEQCLLTHPAVQEVQVFGIPDPLLKEELVCWLKVTDGSEITEMEIKDYCRGQIADWKIPRFVVKVKKFPTQPCGKVQKYVMRGVMVDNVLACGYGPCLKDFMHPSEKVCSMSDCSARQYCESLQKLW